MRGEDDCQKTPIALCQRQGGALRVPVQPRQRLRAGRIVEVGRVCFMCVCLHLHHHQIYRVISLHHHLLHSEISAHDSLPL